MLRARLYEAERTRLAGARAADRKGQVGTGDRSERIRTYNFPQGRVTDHRIGLTLHKIDRVMLGELDEIIDALTAEDEAARLGGRGGVSAAGAVRCADPAGTVGAFLCQAGQHLRAAAIESPRLEARLLLGHAMGAPAEALLREPARAGAARSGRPLRAPLLRRRLATRRWRIILGSRASGRSTLRVSPRHADPPRRFRDAGRGGAGGLPGPRARRCRVLDLGTGTGCLLLAVLAECPRRLRGRPGPRCRRRRRWRAENARAQRPGRPRRLPGRRLGRGARAGRFDLVLSNPPYIEIGGDRRADAGGRAARARLGAGWRGGRAGRLPRRWPRACPAAGARVARAVLELGQGQRAAVEALARRRGLVPLGCRLRSRRGSSGRSSSGRRIRRPTRWTNRPAKKPLAAAAAGG